MWKLEIHPGAELWDGPDLEELIPFLFNWLFLLWSLLYAVRLPLPGPGQAEIPAGASGGLLALHLLPGRSQPPGKRRTGATDTDTTWGSRGCRQGGIFGTIPSSS